MKNFVLEEIKLISQKEQSANSFVFSKGLNIITGQNGMGKSHLIKSIPWVFGAEPSILHPIWINADISAILSFSLDNVKYKILRTGSTYLVFDNKNNLLNSSLSVTKELSPFLAKLFDFELQLPLKNSNELIQLPPAYFFLPFYVDQDSGWVNLWQSFKNLQMFSNWRRPLIDTYTGVVSLELQSIKNNLCQKRLELKTFEKQKELFDETFKSVRDEISNSDFDIDLKEYKDEIEELVSSLNRLQKQEFEYKESIRALSNKKTILENQILIVKLSISSLDKEHKFANSINKYTVECPTCGAEHENSFVEKFNIAQDLYRAQELLVDLEEDLGTVVRDLDKIKKLNDKNSDEIQHVNEILNRKTHKVTVSQVIKKEGEKHLRSFLRDKSGELEIKIGSCHSDVKKLEKTEQDLVKLVKEQKERVENYFIDSMKKNLEELKVNNLMVDDYKDIYSGNVPEAGSEKPRAFLAHVFSLIKTIEEFYVKLTPPIIIDSPNQQDQDPGNVDRIYNFIINRRPNNHQMILGLANGEDRDFGDCNKIILENKGKILQPEKYNEIQVEFSKLLSIGIL
jgi:hypothetical protein